MFSVDMQFLICVSTKYSSVSLFSFIFIHPSTSIAWWYHRSLLNMYLLRLKACVCACVLFCVPIYCTCPSSLIDRYLAAVFAAENQIQSDLPVYLQLLCRGFCPDTEMHTQTHTHTLKYYKK